MPCCRTDILNWLGMHMRVDVRNTHLGLTALVLECNLKTASNRTFPTLKYYILFSYVHSVFQFLNNARL